MIDSRLKFFSLLWLATIALPTVVQAQAHNYPNKPIRL
jgi:hypothetical protein